LPVYPVARAESRLWIKRIERDWSDLIDTIQKSEDDAEVTAARKGLTESLVAIAPIFSEKPYFMSEDFSIVDCCVAPILWRLPVLGIELPERQCKPLIEYMERLFDRDSFRASLSETEREMRD